MLWHVIATSVLQAAVLPAPLLVLQTGREMLESGELFEHINISLQRILAGFLIGSAIAAPAGLLMGSIPIMRAIFDPYVQFFRFVPSLAWLTPVVIWFGIGGNLESPDHRLLVQNHLLQLVALTAMEPPIDFDAESVRNEKVKVLRALRTPNPRAVIRGQYGRGFIEGVDVPGYREEPGVAPDSNTEAFVAARLFVDNWRWADTPFFVRTGKRLPRRETTIAIQFKRAPHPPFEDMHALRPNVLFVHVQPNEGVSLAIGAKVPGEGMRVRTVHMDFLYGGTFRTGLPEAYERLILDTMLGDPTLFTRADEIEEQWALVDVIAATWTRERPNFPNYAAGTGAGRGSGARGMASVAIEAWADDCATIEEIEDALADLRLRVGHRGVPDLRTSVLTHLARVPQEWQTAATETLAGLGEQHPSRTLLLFPEPGEGDRLAARVFLECHPLEGDGRQLCNEVVELRLGGSRPRLRPASRCRCCSRSAGVHPLARPTPFRTEQFRQMIEIVDRLIVDSAEWPDVPGAYAELEDVFEAAAVSDIAWRRTLPWREALAAPLARAIREDRRPPRRDGARRRLAALPGWSRGGARER